MSTVLVELFSHFGRTIGFTHLPWMHALLGASLPNSDAPSLNSPLHSPDELVSLIFRVGRALFTGQTASPARRERLGSAGVEHRNAGVSKIEHPPRRDPF
jgi:hypothetical protein